LNSKKQPQFIESPFYGKVYLASDGSFYYLDFSYQDGNGIPIIGIGFLNANGHNDFHYYLYKCDSNNIYYGNIDKIESCDVIGYALSNGVLRLSIQGSQMVLDELQFQGIPFSGNRFFEKEYFDGTSVDLTYTDKEGYVLIGFRANRQSDYVYHYIACTKKYMLVYLSNDWDIEECIVYEYSYNPTSKTLVMTDVDSSRTVLSLGQFIDSPFTGYKYVEHLISKGLSLDFSHANADGVPLIGIRRGSVLDEYEYYCYKCDKEKMYIGDVNRIDECTTWKYSFSNSEKQLKIYYSDGAFIELKESGMKVSTLIKDTATAAFGVASIVGGIYLLNK
jgi:hypothetical protein